MFNLASLPTSNSGARLRLLTRADAARFAEGANDPVVRQFALGPGPPHSTLSVTRMIEGEIADGMRLGTMAVLAICDPSTNQFAGSLLLLQTSPTEAEVGFWVHPDERGRGRARGVLSLTKRLAAESGILRLTARTLPINEVAQRVLLTSGFSFDYTSTVTNPWGGGDMQLDCYEVKTRTIG